MPLCHPQFAIYKTFFLFLIFLACHIFWFTCCDRIRFSAQKKPDPKNRLFNRFSVIKCNQLRANRTSCHWFIFALVFSLCILSNEKNPRDRMNADKENFLRNGWNWEINRLISRRVEEKKTDSNPFLCCSFSDGTSFAIAISSCLSMSDDTVEEMQQVSNWLHSGLKSFF